MATDILNVPHRQLKKRKYRFALLPPKDTTIKFRFFPTSPYERQPPSHSTPTPASKILKPAPNRHKNPLKDLFKPLLYVLCLIADTLGLFFGSMGAKKFNAPILTRYGPLIVIFSIWIYFTLTKGTAREMFSTFHFSPTAALCIDASFPGLFGLIGTLMFFGGIRLSNGQSFTKKYFPSSNNLPGFKNGFAFVLGNHKKSVRLTLKQSHTGYLAFGGIGTGKTVSFMYPAFRQLVRQLDHPDPNHELAKFGALILDRKGDFIDTVITEMILAGRSLSDLVIIDPDLDLFRVNPIDPNKTADENAAKLATIAKLIGGGAQSKDPFWDNSSKNIITYFLRLLEAIIPKNQISLTHIAEYIRDEDFTKTLTNDVMAVITKKHEQNAIHPDTYAAFKADCEQLLKTWITLSDGTRSNLKVTINNMLSTIASNPRLQKVFCRDTNFDIKQIFNEGKIVLFRSNKLDKDTAKLITVSLKLDFQGLSTKRQGAVARENGLNETRTCLFMCDEYQEFVTCGPDGDQAYYAVCRSYKIMSILATQSRNSLEEAINNEKQLKALLQAVGTILFYRTTDRDTAEHGAFLAGKSEQEKISTSQDASGLLTTLARGDNNSSKGGGNLNISQQLEDNFRADAFTRLRTITPDTDPKGPYFSECIIYHYHDTDVDHPTNSYQLEMEHLYYSKELQNKARLYVESINRTMFDRTAQLHVIRDISRHYTSALQLAIQEAKEQAEQLKIQAQKEADEQNRQKAQQQSEAAQTTAQTSTTPTSTNPPSPIQATLQQSKNAFGASTAPQTTSTPPPPTTPDVSSAQHTQSLFEQIHQAAAQPPNQKQLSKAELDERMANLKKELELHRDNPQRHAELHKEFQTVRMQLSLANSQKQQANHYQNLPSGHTYNPNAVPGLPQQPEPKPDENVAPVIPNDETPKLTQPELSTPPRTTTDSEFAEPATHEIDTETPDPTDPTDPTDAATSHSPQPNKPRLQNRHLNHPEDDDVNIEPKDDPALADLHADDDGTSYKNQDTLPPGDNAEDEHL